MQKLLHYINRRQWAIIALSVAFIVVQVWLDLKLPDYMSAITTLVQTEGSAMEDILAQGGYMLLCALGSGVSSVIVGYFAARVAAGLARTLRGEVFDKTLDFSMEEVDRFSTASLINRTTNDITQVQNLVAMGLQAIVKAPIMAVWAVLKIAGKDWHWTAATAAAVFILILVLAITLIFALPRFRRIQGLTDNLNRVTREQLTGIRVVRAYNAEEYQEKKFAAANDEVTATNMTANRVMALMSPTMTLLSSGLTLAVYWIGAYLIDAADMDSRLAIFSDMVVFSNYAMQVIMAFMLLNMIFVLLPRAQVSANRIFEVLNTRVNITDGPGAETAETGTVEFRDVSFRYPGAAADSLRHISFTAKRGETVALIGATGSGKTTLINLIPRFYDATEGEVLVDGVDVRAYGQKDLRRRIGYVSQKAVLFSGTVASNVAYGETGRGEITEDDVREAVSVAQATEFVEKMDGAYGAAIAQSGANVSGGQKQRLSIARAMLEDAPLLILDEATSSVDTRTELQVQQAMDLLTRGRTSFVIAHRLSTIQNADCILVMKDGDIIESGTHDELLAKGGFYADLYNSQFEPAA